MNEIIFPVIIVSVLALFFGGADSVCTAHGGREKILPALTHIQQTLYRTVSVTELAALCNLSPSHFRRLFKSLMGKSPIRYKNQVVMQHACRLLDSGVMNISEIANALGITDIYTFSQTFKKEVGVSPSRYTARKGTTYKTDVQQE